MVNINDTRDIKININDNLIIYLSNRGEPSPDGNGFPFYFASRIKFIINHRNMYTMLIM
ncbi:hypothetical protein [Clostridium beijerinckii]|uniref:hypothetical protein n=1 Tax=Clostridium beijerinckii TaxID=1520 RepID=UPI001639B6B9|nr:hypothetical protein [Clostridium beijerinckii]